MFLSLSHGSIISICERVPLNEIKQESVGKVNWTKI
jgi:hypothetical protein